MGCSGSKQVRLSDTDLEYLKQHTDFDEATIKDWFEGFKKDCPNGRLSKSKFSEIYQLVFREGNPDDFSNHVFRTFDADNNGFIDFKEFLLAVGMTSVKDPEERLKWAFRMYDINNDGTIEQKEMTKIVEAIFEMLGSGIDAAESSPAERAKTIFDKMDTNNDGKLSLDEFLSGCMEDEEIAKLLTINAQN